MAEVEDAVVRQEDVTPEMKPSNPEAPSDTLARPEDAESAEVLADNSVDAALSEADKEVENLLA